MTTPTEQPTPDAPLTGESDYSGTVMTDRMFDDAKAMRAMLDRLKVANTRYLSDGALAVEFRRLASPAPASSEGGETVKRTMTLTLTDAEMIALEKVMANKDLSAPAVFRNSFRLYQMVDMGGATVTVHESGPLGLPSAIGRAPPPGDGELEAALYEAWTDFLDANPDDLTSPSDLPDHALVTADQMVDAVKNALAALAGQTKREGA